MEEHGRDIGEAGENSGGTSKSRKKQRRDTIEKGRTREEQVRTGKQQGEAWKKQN